MTGKDEKTTIKDFTSTGNNIGMHIGPHGGNLEVIGGVIRNSNIGIMVGGNPAAVASQPAPTQSTVVTIEGGVHAPVNIVGGGHASITAMTIGEISSRIDASEATEAEKQEAKSKLQEFIQHPLVTAIVGSLVSGAIGS